MSDVPSETSPPLITTDTIQMKQTSEPVAKWIARSDAFRIIQHTKDRLVDLHNDQYLYQIKKEQPSGS